MFLKPCYNFRRPHRFLVGFKPSSRSILGYALSGTQDERKPPPMLGVSICAPFKPSKQNMNSTISGSAQLLPTRADILATSLLPRACARCIVVGEALIHLQYRKLLETMNCRRACPR